VAKITTLNSGANYQHYFLDVAQITGIFIILGCFWRKLHTPVTLQVE